MACLVDYTPLKYQLMLTNLVEENDKVPRYHMKRISIHVLKFEGVGSTVGGLADRFRQLSEKDMKLLNWQDNLENLQNDSSVYFSLVKMAEKICPLKSGKLAVYHCVTDKDTQQNTEDLSLSSHQHSSFRSLLVTRHINGQVELLSSHDSDGGASSHLRWRSNDLMKIEISDSKAYELLWLVQWDIVDRLNQVSWSDPHAWSCGESRRSAWNFPLEYFKDPPPQICIKHVRYRHSRRSPYVVDMRLEKCRRKKWFGSFKTRVAAARAVDAVLHYYSPSNNVGGLNFEDSPLFLEPIPPDLTGDEKLDFVKAQARQIGNLFDGSTLEFTRSTTTLCGVAGPSSVGDTVGLQGSLRSQSSDMIRSESVQSFGAQSTGNSVPINRSRLCRSNFVTPEIWINSGTVLDEHCAAVQATSCASNSFQETDGSMFSSQLENQWLSGPRSFSTDHQVYERELPQLRSETYEPSSSSMVAESTTASLDEELVGYMMADLLGDVETAIPASQLSTLYKNVGDRQFAPDTRFWQPSQDYSIDSLVENIDLVMLLSLLTCSPSSIFAFIFSIQFRTIASLKVIPFLMLHQLIPNFFASFTGESFFK